MTPHVLRRIAGFFPAKRERALNGGLAWFADRDA